MRRFFPVLAGAVDDAPVTGATPALRPMLPETAHDTALILIVSLFANQPVLFHNYTIYPT